MTTPAETSMYKTLPLATDPAVRRRYMIVDEPIVGNFRFGLLLEDLDIMAEQVALGYARQIHPDAKVVTAAIDNIIVRHVVDNDRDIRIAARLNHVGRSSMVVGMRVEHAGEPATHIASCYFTMVARGGESAEESRVLPPLEYKMIWSGGGLKKRLRNGNCTGSSRQPCWSRPVARSTNCCTGCTLPRMSPASTALRQTGWWWMPGSGCTRSRSMCRTASSAVTSSVGPTSCHPSAPNWWPPTGRLLLL